MSLSYDRHLKTVKALNWLFIAIGFLKLTFITLYKLWNPFKVIIWFDDENKILRIFRLSNGSKDFIWLEVSLRFSNSNKEVKSWSEEILFNKKSSEVSFVKFFKSLRDCRFYSRIAKFFKFLTSSGLCKMFKLKSR